MILMAFVCLPNCFRPSNAPTKPLSIRFHNVGRSAVTKRESFNPDYFERLYAIEADPWRFASSNYERAKYKATLDTLKDDRYEAVFEVGCSIGILTRMLAPNC